MSLTRGPRRRAASSRSAHLSTVNFDELLAPISQFQREPHWIPYLRQSRPPTVKIPQPENHKKDHNKWNRGQSAVKLEVPSNRNQKRSKSSNVARPVKTATGKVTSSDQVTLLPKFLRGSVSPERGNDTVKTIPLGMVMMGTATTTVSHVNTPTQIGSKAQCTRERVQVMRSKEEKDKSPDCIRMDKSSLRVFPDIGGGESVTLKLLSLQHNLITRLENVPLLSQLVVLDLYNNRIERITALQGLPSLRVLLLGKNRIKRIEGMDSLKRLEILDLHGNQLRYVDNIGPLTSLRVLNLAGNLLRSIRTLGPFGLSSLMELNLKRNRIRNLEGLQRTPHLKKLLIANNDLQSFASLAPLRKLVFLQELVMDPNPLISTAGSDYKSQVLTLFPHLQTLDRTLVTDEMRQEAKLWHKKKLAEEVARKEEEERLRKELDLSVGPPGSREQSIYQARRRWESVRTFVKNTPGPGGTSTSPGKEKAPGGFKAVVKKVIESPNPRFPLNQLYPPATLDLEQFPDGHEQLDQMGSLLSDAEYHQEEEKKEEIVVYQRFKMGKLQPNLEPLSDETDEDIKTFENEGKVEESVEDQLKKNDYDYDYLQNDDLEVKNLESEAFPENNDNDHVQPQDDSNFVSKGENLAIQRASVTRVAIVRPLIRDLTFNNEIESSSKTGIELEPFYADLNSPLTHSRGSFEESSEEPSPAANELQLEREDFPSGELILSKLDDPEISLPSIHEDVESPPETVEVIPPIVEEKEISKANSATTTEKTPPPSSPRPKLLKHLRSISLDSGTGMTSSPFLEPPTGYNSSLPSDVNDNSDDEGATSPDQNDTTPTIAIPIPLPLETSRQSSAVTATTNRLVKEDHIPKTIFPRTRSQRLKLRDRAAKLARANSSFTSISPRPTTSLGRRPLGNGLVVTAVDAPPPISGRVSMSGKVLRRCESATSLTTPSSASTSSGTTDADGKAPLVTPHRKQGIDFLVEVDVKILNIFGQGGLRHAVTSFPTSVTCQVAIAKFHYISYDAIVPYFGKLCQVYPALEHFNFRANNICTLAQLDALSDLQGLSSLTIVKEGNPIVDHTAWMHYASYRLSHWGLQIINGNEICSEYRGGGATAAQAKGFESLGFLALSCLPQSALSPLAKRLHMLHCFCCCSPSTSSDESNKVPKPGNHSKGRGISSPTQQSDHASGSFCTSWDDDPVLLDVIGKEALVYCPPHLPPEPNNPDLPENGKDFSVTLVAQWEKEHGASSEVHPHQKEKSSTHRQRSETFGRLIHSGVDILAKIDTLERVWPTLMTEIIQEILMDFRFMDSYTKKELKKAQDAMLIHHHGKKGS